MPARASPRPTPACSVRCRALIVAEWYHAALLDACLQLLQLLQLQWDGETLDFAVALAEVMLEHFEDRARGGFYFTADDHEQLIHRSREFADDATPAGNGVAALALQRLGSG